jgi:hypothetical protein
MELTQINIKMRVKLNRLKLRRISIRLDIKFRPNNYGFFF